MRPTMLVVYGSVLFIIQLTCLNYTVIWLQEKNCFMSLVTEVYASVPSTIHWICSTFSIEGLTLHKISHGILRSLSKHFCAVHMRSGSTLGHYKLSFLFPARLTGLSPHEKFIIGHVTRLFLIIARGCFLSSSTKLLKLLNLLQSVMVS